MAEEEKGEQGLPKSQQEQGKASEVAEFDPKKTYNFRGKKVVGKDLESMIYRGEGYSKLQSELDQMKAQLAQANNDRDLLMAELQKIDRDKQKQDIISEALSSMKKQQSNGFNNDYEEDDDEQQPLDMDKILQTLQNMQQGITNDVTTQVTQKTQKDISDYLKQLLQEQETNKRTQQFINDLDTMTKHQLQTQYPNFAKNDEANELFDKIVELNRKKRGLQVEIGSLWEKQDPSWIEKQTESAQLDLEIGNLTGEAILKDRSAKELAEAMQIVGSSARPLREVPREERPVKQSEVQKWLTDREKNGRLAWEAEMKALNMAK